jgi:hypothetical protein
MKDAVGPHKCVNDAINVTGAIHRGVIMIPPTVPPPLHHGWWVES